MNFLFVVEGKSTEKKLYQKWIPYLLPHMKYVQNFEEIIDNNFIIINGGGYPNYFKKIKDAFLDAIDYVNISHIFICIDAEDSSYDEKKAEITDYIKNECPLTTCFIKIIIQNSCIESWLMGNKRINIDNAQDVELTQYRNYFNVNIRDPELLTPIDERTIGQFSKRYLQLMLNEKGLIYSINSVQSVNNQTYFEQLVKRYQENNHIISFGIFFEEIKKI